MPVSGAGKCDSTLESLSEVSEQFWVTNQQRVDFVKYDSAAANKS